MRKKGDLDQQILDLTTAIILFNPDINGLIDREAIRMEQHNYMHLLKRYLQIKFSSICESNGNLLFLGYIDKRIRQTHAGRPRNQIPDLVQEILDLANNCHYNSTTCIICGDKATGYNFNALTCESCKAFFRRNGLKGIKSCNFDDNCVINLKTRRICGYCRLKKCFDCGMKKDWIWNEEAKECRRMKIQMNRFRRLLVQQKQLNESVSSTTLSHDSSPEPMTSLLDIRHPVPQSTNISFILTVMANNNNNHNVLTDGLTNSDTNMFPICDTIYQKAVQMEMAVLPIARPTLDSDHTFSELEGNRFTELLFATKCMKNELKTIYTSEVFSVDDYFVTLDQKCEQELYDLDQQILDLMTAIILFNPDINGLIDREAISN
ncbi:unnamed protein product [Oppiella nova]|uniref:Nuclear receptor domain-containing protein n=1 Tax=Oppiella nova TaxID=334625 RepID=A0A7R9M8X3_9ACAR|nr:unnamed protein product [Oppiella nova]CAG2172417.1 unnamed protein product [Oppiella nova]